jgi:hypothetical protein
VTEGNQFKLGNNHVAIAAAVGPFLINGAVEFTKWLTAFRQSRANAFSWLWSRSFGAIAWSALKWHTAGRELTYWLGSDRVRSGSTALLAAHSCYTQMAGKTSLETAG